MKKISKKDMPMLIFAVLMLIFFIYILGGDFLKVKSLDKNLEYANAVITDLMPPDKYANMYYKFFVNGNIYKDGGKYYPKIDSVSIGDTIIVVYDRTDPNNSRTLRDYERSKKERPFIIPFFLFIGLVTWWRLRKRY